MRARAPVCYTPMPEVPIFLSIKTHSPSPLTSLSEEEQLFYATVRQFALETIAPAVRAMDDEQQLAPGLVQKLMELGLMGIEVPEALGGSGGSFFDAVLAIEAISQVDPGVAVLVDVHNTLVVNATRRWATEDQRVHWLPMLAAGTVGAYALSEAGSGSDAFALQTRAEQVGRRPVMAHPIPWSVQPDGGRNGMSFENISFSIEDGVARLRLNRPSFLNALTRRPHRPTPACWC